MTSPRIITSWDDGHPLDTRVAQLLLEYDLRDSIFYWPVNAVVTKPTWATDIAKTFQIGGHTVNHAILTQMKPEAARNEITGCRDWLVETFPENAIESFCYPRGRWNPEVRQMVIDAGFSDARTTIIGNAGSQPDRFITPADVHCFNRKEYGGEHWLDYALKAWTVANVEGYPTFHIWGHSWEIEKYNDWESLENLFSFISEPV